jgi:16S rRNA (guanine527-N7)-methyltransferase
VGSVEPSWVVDNLFIDSLMFLKVLPPNVHDLADLGTGAGFPGVPLRIVQEDLRLTLVEARQRRTSFLSALIRELGLSHVRILNERAEALIERPELRFDAVVLRCAGPLSDVFPVASKLVKSGGIVVATGPPEPTPSSSHEWVDVSTSRGTRRFAVMQV